MLSDFIFATPATVRKIKLSKEGFQPLFAKLKSDGVWYGLSHVYANGDERWTAYVGQFVEKYLENLPADVTLEELILENSYA